MGSSALRRAADPSLRRNPVRADQQARTVPRNSRLRWQRYGSESMILSSSGSDLSSSSSRAIFYNHVISLQGLAFLSISFTM